MVTLTVDLAKNGEKQVSGVFPNVKEKKIAIKVGIDDTANLIFSLQMSLIFRVTRSSFKLLHGSKGASYCRRL